MNKNENEPQFDKRYVSAIKDFTKFTINNPDFFKRTPEEQKELAMKTLLKHKEVNENNPVNRSFEIKV